MIRCLDIASDELIAGLGEGAFEPKDTTLVSNAMTSNPGESFFSQPLDNTSLWGIVAVLGVAILSLFIVALIDVRKKK